MPTLDLFEPSTEQAVYALVRKVEPQDMRMFHVAQKYAVGRMRDDVESELSSRYPDTQRSTTEGIQPQTIPITERYLEEAATLYSNPVTRELVDPDGNVDAESTDALNRLLGDSFDEQMEQIERSVVLTGSAAAWFQARAGGVRVVTYGAQDVSPIRPEECTWFSPGDQADYLGFAVRLGDNDNAYIERAQTVFYAGASVNQPGGEPSVHPNAFVWPQVHDTEDQRGDVDTLPLMMLTAWHSRPPGNAIMPDVDIPIVELNRELNVQWSILLDTISHQGWTQFYANVADPSNPPSVMQMGPRNVAVLGPGETMTAVDSGTNYTGLVGVLSEFAKSIAQSKGLPPQDMAAGAGETQPASGFAKLVDALPKIKSRKRLGVRMARQEATLAWPRIAVIGAHVGAFRKNVEQLAQLRLRTSFADLDMPSTVAEENARHEFDLKHNLTTAARILAERRGITVEEAQAAIDENRATAPTPAARPEDAPSDRAARSQSLIGTLIGGS